MKFVELEILFKNGNRQKIAPVWNQNVDEQWIEVESDERYVINKRSVAKAVFSLKDGKDIFGAVYR